MSIKRNVEGAQRSPRLLAFKVQGDAVTASIVSGSTQATLTDNGAGDYELAFSDVFRRAPICVATSETTGVVCEIDAANTDTDKVTVLCFDTATGATPTDCDFHLLVMGYDSSDEL